MSYVFRDLNTRFSGLSVEDIANATHDLEATRSELCTVIDENTIIIGHGYVAAISLNFRRSD
jgi:hypothetical protein